MFYYVGYYVKKYWYLIILLVIILFTGVTYLFNNYELISEFVKFENKISFEPEYFEEESIDKASLDSLIVGAPYLATYDKPYVPSNILGTSAELDYINEVGKDPNYMYRKEISWARGEVTSDELIELVELIGFHLNKESSSINKIVSIPTPEQLSEFDKELLFYTDNQGVLFVSVYVEELNQSTNTKKTYLYEFKLKYDLFGKITIM